MKHESSSISCHHSLKSISEALEQKLSSSKDIREAQRVFLTNSKSCMALSKGVYRKDDCVKIKSKDSNNTRSSKQNTYHVVNKNIAPSKVTDGSRRKEGMPSGASQSFGF